MLLQHLLLHSGDTLLAQEWLQDMQSLRQEIQEIKQTAEIECFSGSSQDAR